MGIYVNNKVIIAKQEEERLKKDLANQKEINDSLIVDNIVMQMQIDDLILEQLL